MKIYMKIDADHLGYFNTAADNADYAAAVKSAIRNEYPTACVTVDISNESSVVCYGVDGDEATIIERCNEIAGEIWSDGSY